MTSTCNHHADEVVEEGLQSLRHHTLPSWAQSAMIKAQKDTRKFQAKLAAAEVELEAAREREAAILELQRLMDLYVLAAEARPSMKTEAS